MDSDRLYTITEAAQRTGLTRKAIEQRVGRGSLPSVLKDGKRYIHKASIEALATLTQSETIEAETTLAAMYAEARYELGVRDGEAKARAELTDGWERRERDLSDALIEAKAIATAAQAKAVDLEEQLQAQGKRWWKRKPSKDGIPKP